MRLYVGMLLLTVSIGCTFESPVSSTERGLEKSALPYDWCDDHPDDYRCFGAVASRSLTTDERWALMQIIGIFNNVDPFCVNLQADVNHVVQGSTRAYDDPLYVSGGMISGFYDYFYDAARIYSNQFFNQYRLATTVVHEAAHRYFGPGSEEVAKYAAATCVQGSFN